MWTPVWAMESAEGLCPGRGKISVSCEGNVCACAFVCMSLCAAGRWTSSERPCIVMCVRACDCVRLDVRNSECVCEVDCARE